LKKPPKDGIIYGVVKIFKKWSVKK